MGKIGNPLSPLGVKYDLVLDKLYLYFMRYSIIIISGTHRYVRK